MALCCARGCLSQGKWDGNFFKAFENWAGAVCPLAIVVQEQNLSLGIPLTNQPKLWPKRWPSGIQLCFANSVYLPVSFLTQFLSPSATFALCSLPHFFTLILFLIKSLTLVLLFVLPPPTTWNTHKILTNKIQSDIELIQRWKGIHGICLTSLFILFLTLRKNSC